MNCVSERTVNDEHDEEHAGAEAAGRVLGGIGSLANDVGVAECRDNHRNQRYDEDTSNPLSICAEPTSTIAQLVRRNV